MYYQVRLLITYIEVRYNAAIKLNTSRIDQTRKASPNPAKCLLNVH